ncbi:MAG: recombination-associated protein RdgC [Deltaproteobacteria bacterium]|jgi:DNA recombination-dependent growth factor C|nr:recombination-associated protein RdgC [Deltaproteobacteria bacterium]
MSFLKNSTSFTRFKINEEAPASLWPQILDKLRQYSFKDIDDLPEERAWGWAAFEDMLDVEWKRVSPQKGGEYLAFTLRLETRRVPAAVIKKHVGLALKKEEEQIRQQNKTFVSRERKKEIKELVLFQLNKRFLPIPAEFQVIWNTQSGEIWFASTQAKILDLFQEFFTLSFDLRLDQLTPYGLAADFLSEAETAKLDGLQATTFYKS